MNFHDFIIGIWHPFGPHGGETPDEIIVRKRREIEANPDQYTLWSFNWRPAQTLALWRAELAAQGRRVFAFCSEGKGAKEPKGGPTACRSFRFINQALFSPMPAGVQIPHPYSTRQGSRQRIASAFVVSRIVHPVVQNAVPMVERMTDGFWGHGVGFMRTETLIRRGGHTPMPSVRVVLELRAPYLAYVSPDEADSNAPTQYFCDAGHME